MENRSPDMTSPSRHDSQHIDEAMQQGLREKSESHHPNQSEKHHLPFTRYNRDGHAVTKGVRAEGESGRAGIHPLHFLRIVWQSSCTASKWVNILAPFIPAAIALHFARPDLHLWIFALSFIAMLPSANLLGFAGQELARKLPKVFGVILETTLGSLVEVVLFLVLIIHRKEHGVPIIQAAILGSILANLLLCLGVCFFIGGMKRSEQTFHDAVSDTGSNLMLVAGMALVIPTAYAAAIGTKMEATLLNQNTTRISRATAIVLLCAFIVYVYFQLRSHHSLYDDILEGDEQTDRDRRRDLHKPKLTVTESILALVIALTFVSLLAVFLVEQIEPLVEKGISDAFLGLILVPLVEKIAEHLTAVDEAYDGQMNFALSHVLGSSIQTALLNTPIVVIVGWGMNVPMNLDFATFNAVVLILAILVVGGFLRDGKSNYLEGVLCVFVYILIAVAAFYYPNFAVEAGVGESTSEAH